MRLVRTLIHEDDRDGVVDVLESENIDYIVYREASGRSELFVVEFVDSQRFPPETKRDSRSHVTVPAGTPTDAPRVAAGG